jgi:hypothetical protein
VITTIAELRQSREEQQHHQTGQQRPEDRLAHD